MFDYKRAILSGKIKIIMKNIFNYIIIKEKKQNIPFKIVNR